MSNLDKNIKAVVAGLVKPLSTRNRDIVSRRFGLTNGRIETLESIGQTYGITRERVRQIEDYVLKNLRTEVAGVAGAKAKPYFDLAADLLSQHGGFSSEESLFKNFSGAIAYNVANASLAFLLSLNPDFGKKNEGDDLYAFWYLNDGSREVLTNLVSTTVSALQEKKTLLPEADLYNLYKTRTKSKVASTSAFLSAINISKQIDKNIFLEYGLASWPEIKPRGVRDRAYLVLKKESKPKHFREITSLINVASFSTKKANVQTVHNELIKDNRFVLVGRGIYGLVEWGYKSGTVKDVLVDILKESSKPLSKTELVSKVLSSRYVKENTILLNLQDGKVFSKKGDGTYTLKNA
ncbi:MAG: sigma factor-like helix-turn-helix DNA-binding protein [bacterium]|nr:sigma factor-like helix-turn-helix DNA-binding protein [bacterium]